MEKTEPDRKAVRSVVAGKCGFLVAIAVDSGGWPPEAELRAMVERAIGAVSAELEIKLSEPCEISFLFSDDEMLRTLNAKWRGIDKPTNVLSFPAGPPPDRDRLPPVLGDVVLSHDTLVAEAKLDKKPFLHHLYHLIVHGTLHLFGFDHGDDDEAAEMESLEIRILDRLAVPDPYA